MRWLWRLWQRFLGWLRSRWLRADTDGERREAEEAPRPELPPPLQPYRVVHASEEPEELAARRLYAIGEGEHIWHVLMLCPCGCSATIALNLLPDDSPRWRLSEDPEGPTLHPSVWRTAGCRSHFFVRRGQVIWCRARFDAADRGRSDGQA